jgi:2-phosphoglycerate kinase
VALDDVDSLNFEDDGSLIVHSRKIASIQTNLPRLAKENGIRLSRMEAIDESLESLFEYIVER